MSPLPYLPGLPELRMLFLLLRPIVVSTGISEVPYMSFRLFGIYYPCGDPYRQSMEWCIHCPAFAASETWDQ